MVDFLLFIHPSETVRRGLSRNINSDAEFGFDSLVAHSKKMKGLQTIVTRAAKSNAPILLRGEEGVGKNKIAQIIHYLRESNKNSFRN